MPWDPNQYLRYADKRERPAYELLDRVPVTSPERIYDLGCGSGNTSLLLKRRWPDAKVTGIDNSAAMLDKARTESIDVDWQEADIDEIDLSDSPDLIYSNAALHWVDSHETLLPRLVMFLKPGGVLAVQMPVNFTAPSHTLLFDLATEEPWREWLENLRPSNPVGTPEWYWRILSSHCRDIDIWTTTYLQVMSGDDPVLEWVRGSALVPFLDRLPNEHREAFLSAYGVRLREAYPQRSSGETLFPFTRLFLVGQR